METNKMPKWNAMFSQKKVMLTKIINKNTFQSIMVTNHILRFLRKSRWKSNFIKVKNGHLFLSIFQKIKRESKPTNNSIRYADLYSLWSMTDNRFVNLLKRTLRVRIKRFVGLNRVFLLVSYYSWILSYVFYYFTYCSLARSAREQIPLDV